MAPTMKEAIVNPDLSVEIVDSPIPKPGPDEVLIKVVVSGSNPKDWKIPEYYKQTSNSGDDIAGTVESFGEKVYGFHKGDRVAAFHVMMQPHGSFAEYAIAPKQTVFPVPGATTFEEAATIPLAAYTAAVALFRELEIPAPWDRAAAAAAEGGVPKRPLIVYGASTAVGAYAIKLAAAAHVHPIIAVGSRNSSFVTPYLNPGKGDRLVDYTAYKKEEELEEALAGAIRESGAPDGRVFDAVDCAGDMTGGTTRLVSRAVAGPPDANGRRPRVTYLLPGVEVEGADPSTDVRVTMVGVVTQESEEDKLFGLVWGQAFSRGLAEGWLTPHPYTAAEGGLDGLSAGLKGLKDGSVRAKKVVYRIADTESVKS